MIGAPVVVHAHGNPDRAVWRDIHPTAVPQEFILEILKFFGEIALSEFFAEIPAPFLVPNIEPVVGRGDEQGGTRCETTLRGRDSLGGFDERRPFLSRRFRQSAVDQKFGFPGFKDIDAVEARFQNIK